MNIPKTHGDPFFKNSGYGFKEKAFSIETFRRTP